MNNYIINLFYVFLSVDRSNAHVSLSEFYTFGLSVNDRELQRQDDGFLEIPIDFEFQFFGTAYRELFISTNGVIFMGKGDNSYVPSQFPLSGKHAVATYWTDSNPSQGGNIFYRQVYDKSTLLKISEEIRSKFVEQVSFNSRWAIIVTFVNVAAYGCTSAVPTGCETNCNQSVTHQTILTSDGVRSFAIFNFNRLDYTSGTANCNAHAQVGFNAGDGKRYFVINSSNSEYISTASLSTSNVGKAGKWMFKIDGDDISSGCNVNGWMNVYPRRLLFFAQNNIEISGPCFHEAFVNVVVEETSIVCPVVDGIKAVCKAPLFNKIGRNRIAIINQNVLFESFLTITDISDRSVTNLNLDVFEEAEHFKISWEPSKILSEYITIKGFIEDYFVSSEGEIFQITRASLNYEKFKRSEGEVVLQHFKPESSKNLQLRKVVLTIHEINAVHIKFFKISRSVLAPKSTVRISPTGCDVWYEHQPSNSEIQNVVEIVSRRSPCPPSVPAEFPDELPNFKLDDSCQPTLSGRVMCDFFHPGAKGCYRSTNNPDGYVAQCCYDFSNNLLLSIPGSGSLDTIDSSNSESDHFVKDIFPFLMCCKLASDCAKYYDKRPPIDSRHFAHPRVTRASGDPHFLTMDDVSYDFNAIGEFIYLKSDIDVIQVRMAQFIDSSTRQPKDACYFSALAFKSGPTESSDVLQVELNALNMFTFKINGQNVGLDMESYEFNGISINYLKNETCVIRMSSGIVAEIKQIGQMFHVILTVPNSLKGKIKGLVGYWDDNPLNDLMIPNGTWVPINSSNFDIHHRFGMTWSTNNHTSLFTYPHRLSWEDYQNPHFMPNFATPPFNSVCGNNQECAYDVMVTGNVEAGTSNIMIMNYQQELQSFYENLTHVDLIRISFTVKLQSNAIVIICLYGCLWSLELLF